MLSASPRSRTLITPRPSPFRRGPLVAGGFKRPLFAPRRRFPLLSMPNAIPPRVNMIVSDENKIVRDRQRLIRREMDRRGISIKAVQLDGGWETPSTVLSYFPADEHKEPATMSVAALYRMLVRKALPAELLSLLLPEGYALVRVPEGIDHDEVADEFADFLKTKNDFHHPESEAGRDLGPTERAALDAKIVHLPLRGKVA